MKNFPQNTFKHFFMFKKVTQLYHLMKSLAAFDDLFARFRTDMKKLLKLDENLMKIL